MRNSMKVILYIDTSDNKNIEVGLDIEGEKQVIRQPLDKRKAQAVLPLVEKLLKDNQLNLKDLSEIRVNEGPGSFTGLRVGVAIANTLGYLLQIPVNGKESTEPTY